jgi:hypothetical protein
VAWCPRAEVEVQEALQEALQDQPQVAMAEGWEEVLVQGLVLAVAEAEVGVGVGVAVAVDLL